jgi:threonine dehydrogenase-like Zn-dependent dehydrogenase
MRRWHLTGVGLDRLHLTTVPVPTPAADELLVRFDACGICFSDIKILRLGGAHPRLTGRDLEREPVVLGHELALTVIAVGAGRRDRFAPSERYAVQPDVFYRGKNVSVGYALAGGMAEYGVIGREVLDGDEGCYLLPIAPTLGDAEAALAEPWACVEAAYHWRLNPDPIVRFETAPSPEAFARAADALAPGQSLMLTAADGPSEPLAVDIGRVHYDRIGFIGPRPNDRSELKGGGTTWLLGAGGPMGQMHLGRALALAEPPAVLVGTDRNAHRLAALQARFGPTATARGVALHLVDVSSAPLPHRSLAPHGFDDIVVLVPRADAVEGAFPRLAPGGVLNLFAGVARGTRARLDLSEIVRNNVRLVGTTGSSIADMRRVLEQVGDGRLNTAASVAAVGGLEALRDGLEATMESRFAGKTVIFPQVSGLPLTPLAALQQVRPDVFARLGAGPTWTPAAEAVLRGETVS